MTGVQTCALRSRPMVPGVGGLIVFPFHGTYFVTLDFMVWLWLWFCLLVKVYGFGLRVVGFCVRVCVLGIQCLF